jgi:hypothetical protein
MARAPRNISEKLINKSRLRQKSYRVDSPSGAEIPHWKVRGLVRGLLGYFSRPSRHRTLDKIYQDVLEQSLLASVEGHNANKSARVNDERINDLVNQLSTKIWTAHVQQTCQTIILLKSGLRKA